MMVDPKVNRAKYERELGLLHARRTELESLGVHILGSSTYPRIDLLFVCRHPLRLLIPQLRQGSLFLAAPMLLAQDIEVLSASAFKAQFDLTDYDLCPPSVVFCNPWTGTPLSYNRMFRAWQYDQHRGPHEILISDHPETHLPFLCMRGIREYHSHPQHSGDEWLLYRTSMNLFSIVLSVWRVCIDLPHLQLAVTDTGCNFNWAVEEKL